MYMVENRYTKIDSQELKLSELIRLHSLEISNEAFCDFYSKLYTILGIENEITDEGFSYYIKDNKTNIKFSAALTGFGAGYFGKKEDLAIVLEFEKIRKAATPIDYRLEYEHDFGKTILGAKNGTPFFEEEE